MAPKSKSKKPPQAATTAKSKSSSKNKLVVVRDRNRFKKTTAATKLSQNAAAAMASLPSGCAVSARPPAFHTPPSVETALRPGTILQGSCGGHDIHLARNAATEADPTNQKGKLLLILPGLMSFGQDRQAMDNNNNNKGKDKTDVNDTEDGNDDNDNGDLNKDKKGDDDVEPDLTAGGFLTTTTPKNNQVRPSSSATMGQLVGLSTDSPSLRIPFSENKTLVFPGKKVRTSSRYLMLSCSQRKKQNVTCKSIFSSAIVFGTPKWECSVSAASNGQASWSFDFSAGATTSGSLTHYGGSERTVDGIARGKGAKKLTPKIISSAVQFSSATPISSKKVTAPPMEEVLSIGSSSDRSSEEDWDAKDTKIGVIATSKPRTRMPPKRQASLKRKRYNLGDDEEEHDDDRDEDEEEADDLANDNKTNESIAEDQEANANERSDEEEIKDAAEVITQSSTPNLPVGRKRFKSDDSSLISHSSPGLAIKPKLSQSPTSKGVESDNDNDKDDSDDGDLYLGEDAKSDSDSSFDLSSKSLKDTRKKDPFTIRSDKKSSSSGAKKKKGTSTLSKTSLSGRNSCVEEAGTSGLSKSTPSGSGPQPKVGSLKTREKPSGSPFRRRRKSPGKGRPKSKFLDLTIDDDEFKFG